MRVLKSPRLVLFFIIIGISLYTSSELSIYFLALFSVFVYLWPQISQSLLLFIALHLQLYCYPYHSYIYFTYYFVIKKSNLVQTVVYIQLFYSHTYSIGNVRVFISIPLFQDLYLPWVTIARGYLPVFAALCGSFRLPYGGSLYMSELELYLILMSLLTLSTFNLCFFVLSPLSYFFFPSLSLGVLDITPWAVQSFPIPENEF